MQAIAMPGPGDEATWGQPVDPRDPRYPEVQDEVYDASEASYCEYCDDYVAEGNEYYIDSDGPLCEDCFRFTMERIR